METNLYYFEYSEKNPEELLDSFYEEDLVVIPKSKDDSNDLIEKNEKLLNLITTFNTLNHDYKKNLDDETVSNIVSDIIKILDNTEYINYSAFTQFFMVYNSNFSIYNELELNQKMNFIFEMLKKYCNERHNMYLNHGYSNIVLQVICDNYSHKRNSKTGINKVLKILEPYDLHPLLSIENLEDDDDFYFLPDKGNDLFFENMLKILNIAMESRKIEQNKLPDLVFKHKGHYYICELKTTKENGGGQNHQVAELANFIKFSEKNLNIHYITFMDGIYVNKIFETSSTPKIKAQKDAIRNALITNKGNYFFNTKSLILFLKNLFTEC